MFEEYENILAIEEELGWETKVKETRDYKVLNEIEIKCLNCNINLINIIKVKESEKVSNIKVICPKCKEESFLIKIVGEIYLTGHEGITIINADTRKVDNIYNTILEVVDV